MEKLLEHLGYATPFIYAAAAYGLFYWLDENASDEAKATLASTLKLKDVNRAAIASALTEVLDRLYTYPLLSLRAFFRSMVFTLLVTAFFVFERRETLATFSTSFGVNHFALFAANTAINVLSDYVALFFIRLWFTVGGGSLEGVLVGSALMSVSVICLGVAFRIAAVLALSAYFGMDVVKLPASYAKFLTYDLTIAAMAVFAWLPLFALSILAIRTRNTLSLAVGQTQLFLKDGTEHPLKAIGLVAAIIVFVVGAAWSLASGLWPAHPTFPVE
jgi:hypothetical protein